MLDVLDAAVALVRRFPASRCDDATSRMADQILQHVVALVIIRRRGGHAARSARAESTDDG
jgi:hypothetical protein